MPVRVAVVQTDPQLGRNADNLADIVARLRDAATQGARLVVFPECAVSGYGFPHLEAARAAAEGRDSCSQARQVGNAIHGVMQGFE